MPADNWGPILKSPLKKKHAKIGFPTFVQQNYAVSLCLQLFLNLKDPLLGSMGFLSPLRFTPECFAKVGNLLLAIFLKAFKLDPGDLEQNPHG